MTAVAQLAGVFVAAVVVGFVVVRLAVGAALRELLAAIENAQQHGENGGGPITGADAGDEVCTHQPEHRTDSSTSGVFRWRCDPRKGGCGFVLERPATRGDYQQ